MKNSENGVTLIALAVAITILLILAGVTIGSLTDSNFLFTATNEITQQQNMMRNETKKMNETLTNQLEDWGL